MHADDENLQNCYILLSVIVLAMRFATFIYNPICIRTAYWFRYLVSIMCLVASGYCVFAQVLDMKASAVELLEVMLEDTHVDTPKLARVSACSFIKLMYSLTRPSG